MPPDVEAGAGFRPWLGVPAGRDLVIGGRDVESEVGGVVAAVQAANVRTDATARRRLCVFVLPHPDALLALIHLAFR